MNNLFGYQGKTVVVTGVASGMGEATARLLVDLGADVYALDVKDVSVPVKKFIKTDLGKKEEIEAAVAQVPEKIDSLFNCAGLPGPPFNEFETTLVNFVGHRHLTELIIPRLSSGASIGIISSLGGKGWKSNMEAVQELLDTEGFESGKAWLEANPDKNWGYAFSKQCLIVYTKDLAGKLAPQKIRVNCINPTTTETPMMAHFEESSGKEFIWNYFRPPCDEYAKPEHMAEPLVFLNSRMAGFVSGQDLDVDYGLWGMVEIGQKDSFVG